MAQFENILLSNKEEKIRLLDKYLNDILSKYKNKGFFLEILQDEIEKTIIHLNSKIEAAAYFGLEENNPENLKSNQEFCISENLPKYEYLRLVCGMFLLYNREFSIFELLKTLHRYSINDWSGLNRILSFLKKNGKIQFPKIINDENFLLKNTRYFRLTDKNRTDVAFHVTSLPLVYRPKKCFIENSTPYLGYLYQKQSVWSQPPEEELSNVKIIFDILELQNTIKFNINFKVLEFYNTLLESNFFTNKVNIKITNSAYSIGNTYLVKSFLLDFYNTLNITSVYLPNKFNFTGIIDCANLINSWSDNEICLENIDIENSWVKFPAEKITESGIKNLKIAIAQSYIGNTEINSSLDLLNFYDQNIKSYLALNINDFYQYLEREAPNAKIPCSFFAQMQNMKEIIDNKNHELWAGMLFDIKGIGLTIFSVFSKDFSIVQDLDLGLGYNSHFNFFDKIKKELIKNNVNFVEFVEDLTLNHLYRRYSLSDLIKFYNGKLKRTSEKYKTYIDTEDEELSREELENIRYFRRILEKWNAFRIINVFDNIFRSKDQSITWELPDGFLIKLNSSERISENIEFFTEEIDLPEINITLTNHLNDRNHFSQVLMESLEGFVIRELLRRTSIDVDKYHKINSIISNRANFSCATDESYKIMSDLLSLAEKTNFYSWRIFWEITESNVNLVPEDILRKFLASFPRKTYKIRKLAHYISVSPNNIGDLKSQYVDILIELSESKLLNYIISSITGEEFLEASVFKKKFPY